MCALPVAAGTSFFSVTTLAASNISFNTATLSTTVSFEQDISNNMESDNIMSAGVIPAFGPTTGSVYFLYGTSPVSLIYQTPTQDINSGVLVTADIRDLAPGTTYYAEAVATVRYVGNDQHPGPAQFLMALLSPSSNDENLRCAGIGLQAIPIALTNRTVTGNIITFTTLIPSSARSHGSGGAAPVVQTTAIPNIQVESAAISTSKVSPGEKVNITATLINKGNHDGSSKITLYINGLEEQSKGVNLASGQTIPTSFTVMRDEPGTYDVYVNSVAAGSFTVDIFNNNDALIYGIIAAITLAIGAVLFVIIKKPSGSR